MGEFGSKGRRLNESLAAHANDLPSCIVYPKHKEGNSFEIRHHMLEILLTFQGLSHEDLNMHITDFFIFYFFYYGMQEHFG